MCEQGEGGVAEMFEVCKRIESDGKEYQTISGSRVRENSDQKQINGTRARQNAYYTNTPHLDKYP